MKYLHTRSPSVVHRDLKPQNVLLDDYRDAKVRADDSIWAKMRVWCARAL